MATEVESLVDEGAAHLRRVADDPQHEARILLAAALERPKSWLIAHAREPVLDCAATDRYEAFLSRRARGEPIAYVLGRREFWSLELEVNRDVLVPRPETELVVERSLAHLPPGFAGAVLDLACGSGAIALAIAAERRAAQVIGTDLAAGAIAVSRRNADRLGIANVEFREGGWYAPVAGERFELVASNPPYIAEDDPRVEPAVRRYEPHVALFSGPTGLEAIEAIAAGAPDHLRPGGWLVLEHGDAQGAAVRGLLADAGFTAVATFRDLAGRERVTEGRWRDGA